MTAANFLAYAAQVTLVVLACAGLPRVLGLRAPGLQYAFWRTVLVVCLLLPIVEPWHPHVMMFVPALDQGGLSAPLPPAPGPPPAAGQAAPFDWAVAVGLVLAGGVVARLAWIGLGMLRLRRMRRRATEAAFGFDDLQQAIGVTTQILWSSDVRHPVTFGVLEPVVLLPLALKSADLPAQRAVVAHELNHAKRRDWAWVVAEEVVRSVFWFHPAIWWLVSRVQLARETVVDELSILVTNARRTYLDTLLAFADDTGLDSSPAFSARRHLFHRVMLLSKEGQMSSIRVATSSCVLILALGGGTWEAVKAFPLYGGVTQDQTPPRDPVSPDTNVRIAQEYWDKANRDTSLTPEQKLDTILKGLAAVDRALAVNPNHVPAVIYKNILLRMQASLTDGAEDKARLIRQADELRDKANALRGPAPAAPAPADAASAALIESARSVISEQQFKQREAQLKAVRIGGDIKAPMKTRDVKPAYPPIAQDAQVQGVVILEILVDTTGKVADQRIVRSIPLLDQAALETVSQWEYTPTLLNGNPVPVLMTVTVNFSLQ
jgi:TonB family protein